jgi:PTH1 family peptidyl-tRNA hydrolase
VKLLVGLGNPGREYENTRHNAGFLVVDRLKERHAPADAVRGRFNALTVEVRIADQKALLIKPTTYMNRSGRAIAEAVNFFKLDPSEDLLVFVDEVALPVGTIRLRAKGSAGGHNGLADIERHLGTDAYCRCRIGIDQPGVIPQADYVLGKFTEEQRAAMKPVIETGADAAEHWMAEGIVSAMNRFNTKPEPKQKAPKKQPQDSTPDASESTEPSGTPTRNQHANNAEGMDQ